MPQETVMQETPGQLSGLHETPPSGIQEVPSQGSEAQQCPPRELCEVSRPAPEVRQEAEPASSFDFGHAASRRQRSVSKSPLPRFRGVKAQDARLTVPTRKCMIRWRFKDGYQVNIPVGQSDLADEDIGRKLGDRNPGSQQLLRLAVQPIYKNRSGHPR